MLEDSQNRFNYFYIHNTLGHFYKDMLDYFSDYLYPRFSYKVIGTYHKAVEYISKTEQYGRETDQPNLPAIALNPTGEFLPSDSNTTGKQLWRFPNLNPGMAAGLFDPIYQDRNIKITPGFMRLTGDVEFIMWVENVYEYLDLRLFLISIFGGIDRVIQPQYFNSFIILPPELVNYRYTNDVTGKSYVIDWESASAYSSLIKSTNLNELVVPVKIRPQLKLSSITDGSTKYGGTDKLSDWRLLCNVNYEISIPSFLVIETDYLVEKIDFELRYGSAYSRYSSFQPPLERELLSSHWNSGINDEEHTPDAWSLLEDATSSFEYTYVADFNHRYYYEVTQTDIDSTANLQITIPEEITDHRLLYINSKFGELSYGDHYNLISTTLIELTDYVELEKGMIIELYVYKIRS